MGFAVCCLFNVFGLLGIWVLGLMFYAVDGCLGGCGGFGFWMTSVWVLAFVGAFGGFGFVWVAV